jgi:hypothetical protein
MIVTFDESCRSQKRKMRKSLVTGPFQSQVCIGLKTSSLHPYAYLGGGVSNEVKDEIKMCVGILTFPNEPIHHKSSMTRPL